KIIDCPMIACPGALAGARKSRYRVGADEEELIRAFDAQGAGATGFASVPSGCRGASCSTPPRPASACVSPARSARCPRLVEALPRHQLSYARVRALPRVATPATDEPMLRCWRRDDRKAEAMG